MRYSSVAHYYYATGGLHVKEEPDGGRARDHDRGPAGGGLGGADRAGAAGGVVRERLRDRARAQRACVDARRVDLVFDALGDPGRRSLVREIAARGDATATELAAELPVTR